MGEIPMSVCPNEIPMSVCPSEIPMSVPGEGRTRHKLASALPTALAKVNDIH